ncbi:MAG: lipase family protein [Clostridia bacterium]|nr:lipase family protein [Clostridia bacterium]
MNLYDLFSMCLSIPYLQTGGSANYAVHREGRVLYIFFEASSGSNDWRINFNFPAKAYKRMGQPVWFAHRGFLDTWKEIEPVLADKIADRTVKKLVITGYSHGAALAMLCHEYVWYNRPDLRQTLDGYGFGSPRVFWGIKNAELSRRWERFHVIRNIDDIVTHLPPAALGYRHVGTMIKLGGSGKYSPVDAHRPENILRELQPYREE